MYRDSLEGFRTVIVHILGSVKVPIGYRVV